jgi:hypothetical protein
LGRSSPLRIEVDINTSPFSIHTKTKECLVCFLSVSSELLLVAGSKRRVEIKLVAGSKRRVEIKLVAGSKRRVEIKLVRAGNTVTFCIYVYKIQDPALNYSNPWCVKCRNLVLRKPAQERISEAIC